MNTQIYSIIHTIFFTNIYSDIDLCQILYTNIFGYSFVLKFYTNVTLWAGDSGESGSIGESGASEVYDDSSDSF